MATPGAPSPDRLSDAPPCPPGPQGPRGERGGARLAEPRIKAGRCRGLAEESGEARWRLCRGSCRFCFSSSPPLRPLFWRSTPILPAPGLWPYRAFHVRIRATFAPLCGPASPRTRTRRLAHPLPRTELARLLALVFPSRSGGSGAGNRSAGDPQASGAAHWLRTLQRNAPETRLASSSPQSRGQPQALSVRAHLHSPADPPSRPFSTDPSPPQGQRPSPAPPHSGTFPHAGRKPSPELSHDDT